MRISINDGEITNRIAPAVSESAISPEAARALSSEVALALENLPGCLCVALFGSGCRSTEVLRNDVDLFVLMSSLDAGLESALQGRLTKLGNSNWLSLNVFDLLGFYQGLAVGEPFLLNIIDSASTLLGDEYLEPARRLLWKGVWGARPETANYLAHRAAQGLSAAQEQLLAFLKSLQWALVDASYCQRIREELGFVGVAEVASGLASSGEDVRNCLAELDVAAKETSLGEVPSGLFEIHSRTAEVVRELVDRVGA